MELIGSRRRGEDEAEEGGDMLQGVALGNLLTDYQTMAYKYVRACALFHAFNHIRQHSTESISFRTVVTAFHHHTV